MAAGKDLDVIVFGATGITGRQVAAYLAARAPAVDCSWAAAGRNPQKVERTLADVGVSATEVIAADVSDPATLRAMAARAKVVLNLVGPYTRFGRPVIEACVAEGASYLDLTGEVPFVREMIDEFDGAARGAGVKVVEVSGFEAMPPDLAVLLAAETARERWDDHLAHVDLEAAMVRPPGLPRASDVMSGGTLQSVAEIAGHPKAAVATDPAALIDDPARAARVRELSPIDVRPRRGRTGAVLAPMTPAAFINPAIIHRTAALLEIEPFTYSEGMVVPGGAASLPLQWLGAGMLAGGQAGIAALARARPAIRSRAGEMLKRVLPGSGFGPRGERLVGWRWSMSLAARTAKGHELQVEIDARGHPGYLSTANILGEAGLMIAADGVTPRRSGCLTPAAALGTESIARFAEADMAIRLAA